MSVVRGILSQVVRYLQLLNHLDALQKLEWVCHGLQRLNGGSNCPVYIDQSGVEWDLLLFIPWLSLSFLFLWLYLLVYLATRETVAPLTLQTQDPIECWSTGWSLGQVTGSRYDLQENQIPCPPSQWKDIWGSRACVICRNVRTVSRSSHIV